MKTKIILATMALLCMTPIAQAGNHGGDTQSVIETRAYADTIHATGAVPTTASFAVADVSARHDVAVNNTRFFVVWELAGFVDDDAVGYHVAALQVNGTTACEIGFTVPTPPIGASTNYHYSHTARCDITSAVAAANESALNVSVVFPGVALRANWDGYFSSVEITRSDATMIPQDANEILGTFQTFGPLIIAIGALLMARGDSSPAGAIVLNGIGLLGLISTAINMPEEYAAIRILVVSGLLYVAARLAAIVYDYRIGLTHAS